MIIDTSQMGTPTRARKIEAPKGFAREGWPRAMEIKEITAFYELVVTTSVVKTGASMSESGEELSSKLP